MGCSMGQAMVGVVGGGLQGTCDQTRPAIISLTSLPALCVCMAAVQWWMNMEPS